MYIPIKPNNFKYKINKLRYKNNYKKNNLESFKLKVEQFTQIKPLSSKKYMREVFVNTKEKNNTNIFLILIVSFILSIFLLQFLLR
uniref:Uncharacterized protein n=1 Tax=Megaviridae environmental sample TaxID=1737588 RepID=A0A5J6VKI4_9VIRU|nr:MAG: hypothetical protein [Megaviridae environmental sample]